VTFCHHFFSVFKTPAGQADRARRAAGRVQPRSDHRAIEELCQHHTGRKVRLSIVDIALIGLTPGFEAEKMSGRLTQRTYFALQ